MENINKPLVSVVIPTHNRKEMLIRLIKNIKKSSYKNLEIIVVDDGSTDGTSETLKNIFSEVKIIKNKKNRLSAFSRNEGMKKARGKYIFFVDDDNILDEDTIKILVKFMENHRDVGITAPLMLYYSKPNVIWCGGGKLNKFLRPSHLYANRKINNLKLSQFIENIDYFPNAYMITKELSKKNKHDYNNFPHNWDEQDFCLKAKNLNYKIVTVTQSKIWHDIGYKRRVTRLSISKTRDQARTRIIFLKKYGNIIQRLFFWALIFPISSIYYLLLITLSNDRNLIRIVEGRFEILKSYIRGTIEGLKTVV